MKKIPFVFLFAVILISATNVHSATRSDSTAVTVARSTSVNNIQKNQRTQNNSAPSLRNRNSNSSISATSASRTTSARTSSVTQNKNQKSSAKTSRNATKNVITNQRSVSSGNSHSRAASTQDTNSTLVLGDGYNECRDVYFTCMDQFCANANDTYRRCICSSRIEEIKRKENALENTKSQLQDFSDLNIDVISKSGSEVKAMVTASEGEEKAASTKDTSESAQTLSGISDILSKTKSKALSNGGTLDIAGDISSIWGTTDLAGGADLANLSGEKLYNQVNAQCMNLASTSCPKQSTLNMVVAAYGMYIENDCNALANNLKKQSTTTQTTIREVSAQMQDERLKTYDAHNSSSINDCIAQVRKDITTETACGTNYVHCLDITGQYLNITDGKPIYSENFYQLENMTSLDGDVLTNQTNHILVETLNKKRQFAERGLNTCSDLADEVWEEFLRQAIAEIYQGQQNAIRTVKNECIDVVNSCYDEQLKNLKDFSNVKEQLLLGQRVELSEEMCKNKLDTCSNLYGGGPNGLEDLLAAAQNTNTMRISDNCKQTLLDYAKELCSPRASDTAHAYPYDCRVYEPGELIYANNPSCYAKLVIEVSSTEVSSPTCEGADVPSATVGYICPLKCYKNCNTGYQLKDSSCANVSTCPSGQCCVCVVKTNTDIITNLDQACGTYSNSLYAKIARYAKDSCMRPSTATSTKEYLSNDVLMDVNSVMDSIKIDMQKALQSECESTLYNGTWSNIPDNSGSTTNTNFYNNVSPNSGWGTCK